MRRRRSIFKWPAGGWVKRRRPWLREHHLLLHDGASIRRLTVRPVHQVLVLVLLAGLAGAALFSLSLYRERMAAAAVRGSQAAEDIARLKEIQADYLTAFGRLDEFRALFADVTCEVAGIQGSLLAVAERTVSDHAAAEHAGGDRRPAPQSAGAAPDASGCRDDAGAGAEAGKSAIDEAASRLPAGPDGDALRHRLADLAAALEKLRAAHGAFLRQTADITAERVGNLEKVLARTGVDAKRLAAAEPAGQGAAGGDYGTGGPFVSLSAAEPRGPQEPAFDPIAVFNTRADHLDSLIVALRALPLAEPLASYEVTSPFGSRDDPFNEMIGFHEGVDLGAPPGSPVLATGDGVVISAGWHDRYGNLVEIDHGHGLTTRYAHLMRVLVRVGEHVQRGRAVGLLGSTGRSTGPHLHYEVRINDQPTDPMKFITAGRDVLKTQ